MYIFIVIYGLTFIGLGFFVRKYPDMIAGYNILSPQRKEQVDINRLSDYLKKTLIALGICLIPIGVVLWFLEFTEAAWAFLIIIPLVVLTATGIWSGRKFGLYRRR